MHHIKRDVLYGIIMIMLTVGFLCPVSVFAQGNTAQITGVANPQYTASLSAWLNVCRTMGINMNKKGFHYSYSAPGDSYKEALSGGRKSNCAKYVSWCLQEYGALEKGQTFYVKGGKIKKKFKNWDETKVTVIKVYKRCKEADLHPGDVVCWAGRPHTCIYAGRNRKGQRVWYDAGRQNTYGKCSGSRFRRITASPSRYLERRKVGFIIRLKGL